MKNERIRVGVVGCGYWGMRHVRVLSGMADVGVTAIDSAPERLAEAFSRHPQIRCARDMDDVLDEIDCVVVATPPTDHARVAASALSAGKHALIEKPLTTSVEDAEMLVKTAETNGVKLMAAHTYLYHKPIEILKAMIAAGELGDILYMDSARLALGIYRRDVNVIWDLAPHDIAIMSYLLDRSPQAVTAWAQSNRGSAQGDLAYLRLEFEAVTTFVNVSWLYPRRVRRLTIVGDRKMAIYDHVSQNGPLRVYDSRVDFDPVAPADSREVGRVRYTADGITSPQVPNNEPLFTQDAHFIECVRNDSEPRTTGFDGLQNVRVLAALDRSWQSGQRVQFT